MTKKGITGALSMTKETKEEKSARNKAAFHEKRKLAQEEKNRKIEEKKKLIDVSEFKDKPLLYSHEIASKICELIESGLSLREIGKIEGMPKPSTIIDWTNRHDDFNERYAKSKELATDFEFDEIREIADKIPGTIFDAHGNRIFDKTELLWRQQRLDVRKFRVMKLSRKKYGEHITIDPPLSDLAKIDVPKRETREEWLQRQS